MHRILLIEDDVEISTMLRNFLITEDFDVITAYDGESACDKFFSDSFSLVLLDLMIPKMNGIEVMGKIRENNTVPIIIISAKDTDSDKTLGLGLGADDYITKPFSVTRDLFRMLYTEYGMTLMISSHLLPEIESIADTVGVINHGKMMKEISMKEIAEMNTAYIELAAEDIKKASYVLAEKMQLSNFKIMDHSVIRIYERGTAVQKISKELMMNDVEISSISQHTETLEDYFLKMTAEAEKSC